MLKSLPSVDSVLEYPEAVKLGEAYSREMVVEWARAAVDELRQQLQGGAELALGDDGKLAPEVVTDRLLAQAERLLCPSLRRVVNATGIVIHTNLGRSPLSPYLLDAIKDVLGSYSNLEYDLEAGARGSRHAHLARLIQAVTGAEDGFAVNNNAAAVLVTLNTLAAGKEAIVSRGELIEIGGSFRIPDVIEAGGAKLCEVGTTNKTRIADYERAITSETAVLLKVHTSNFKVMGFTEEASVKQMAELAHAHGLPLVVDMGSGLLIDLKLFGIDEEQPVKWYLDAGADVVTFSGDKLLGGPQAGFIAGKAEIVERIRNNPMTRALRMGKLAVAATSAMLLAYLSPQTIMARIPTLKLITRPPGEIATSAKRLARGLRRHWPEARIKVAEDHNYAGGGALPAVELPTFVVTIEVDGMSADDLARAFRSFETPIIGRISEGVFRLDCRAILTGDGPRIYKAAKAIRAGRPSK